MADAKRRINRRVDRLMDIFFNRYFIFRTFVAVTLFVMSFAFFGFLLKRSTDLGKAAIGVYGLFVIGLCLLLIAEYVFRTIKLQRAQVIRSYSTIFAVNTFFGLIMPLIYTNVILAVVMRAFARIQNSGTFFCNIRCSVVGYYYNTEVYTQLNNLIFWLILMTAALFIFGGLVERIFRR